MRLSLFTLVVAVLAAPLWAEPARVTVITKEGRHSGTLAVSQVEVEAGSKVQKVPLADIASIQFGETDVIRTRQGKRGKGVVRVEGWVLREEAAERALARADLRFLIPQVSLGTPRKGQIVDAAAALAWAYDAQGDWGVRPPVEAFEQARRAAAVALKLDPNNVLSHFVLGRIHIVFDWDWAAAEREFEQVAALAPGKGDALDSEALLSLALGRWEDALTQLNTALAQDPMDPPSLFVLAEIQMRRGHLTEAEAAMRRALDIRPTQAYAHVILGLVVLAKGDRDAALLAMQKETAEDGQQGGLAVVYYALGRKAESDAALAGVIKKYADSGALGIAEVYSFRGQVDEAMHWLERAYVQKDSGLYAIKGDPLLKNLEGDPRYKAFLKKMNLPE